MSKTLVQPVGQKRLTNVAVVRLKKNGQRFEIACYKNKVLSWRSKVEKDIDEVLQSQTVYSNVSKGVLAKSKDLIKAFGTDDQSQICLEILEKGELQVAGKERDSQYSSQFRDIATIVMQKTINTETQRPYTISMIERLMHEIHFSVDPNTSSKKQALDLIKELQKHFPIKRSPMRLRLVVPQDNFSNLIEKTNNWDATIVSKEESSTQPSIVCEIEPSLFRECDSLLRSMQGRLEILSVSSHSESDTHVENYDNAPDEPSNIPSTSSTIPTLSTQLEMSSVSSTGEEEEKNKGSWCKTCEAFVGDAKEYREHFKSEWHKHNLKRKTRGLGPVSVEECLADAGMEDLRGDLKEYSF
ncbi:hypothetical protein LUZ60_015953 [Juncus effusus]|nr:hypothetical protein LUZ60_015953 [Juncus effusus]